MVGKSPHHWIGFVGKILTGNHGFSREDHGWLDSGKSSLEAILWPQFVEQFLIEMSIYKRLCQISMLYFPASHVWWSESIMFSNILHKWCPHLCRCNPGVCWLWCLHDLIRILRLLRSSPFSDINKLYIYTCMYIYICNIYIPRFLILCCLVHDSTFPRAAPCPSQEGPWGSEAWPSRSEKKKEVKNIHMVN